MLLSTPRRSPGALMAQRSPVTGPMAGLRASLVSYLRRAGLVLPQLLPLALAVATWALAISAKCLL
jgi:hypothetical protein